jgi:hypothetical protein
MDEAGHPVTWVKLKKYCELTGDTPAAVHARRRSGKWLDGVHCRIADDLLWVSLPEAQKWVATWGPRQSASG